MVAPNVPPEDDDHRGRVEERGRRAAFNQVRDQQRTDRNEDADTSVHGPPYPLGVSPNTRRRARFGFFVLGGVVLGRRVVSTTAAEACVHMERALVVMEAGGDFGGRFADEHLLAVGKRDDGVRSLLDQLDAVGVHQKNGVPSGRVSGIMAKPGCR